LKKKIRTKQGLNETRETEWHQNFDVSENKHRGQQHSGRLFLFCQVKNRELLEKVSF
jgi:hypothetical protein